MVFGAPKGHEQLWLNHFPGDFFTPRLGYLDLQLLMYPILPTVDSHRNIVARKPLEKRGLPIAFAFNQNLHRPTQEGPVKIDPLSGPQVP